MHRFLTFLKKRLKEKLPGRNAQLKMAPEPVSGGNPRQMEAPEDASQSSVLVLLFPNEENELELVLTLRSDDIDHGGQISFPGGRAEKDESVIETALREAREEIGIEPEQVKTIGYLSELFVAHSNNRVAPVVGFLSERPEFKINPAEVEEVFAVELDSLLHKKNLLVENWDLQTYTYRVPYWNVHRVPLWGATAMMLSELLDLYREYLEG
jgi:8-oxo-dGTP pyrophosphatase MutT (NUDIX family)